MAVMTVYLLKEYLNKIHPKTLWNNFWWRFVPGEFINVRWPKGPLIVDHNDPRWADLGGAVWVQIDSADPNDHYRPYLEQHVGRQGWDWNWRMVNNDVADNRITIKIKQKHARYATLLAMRWS